MNKRRLEDHILDRLSKDKDKGWGTRKDNLLSLFGVNRYIREDSAHGKWIMERGRKGQSGPPLRGRPKHGKEK